MAEPTVKEGVKHDGKRVRVKGEWWPQYERSQPRQIVCARGEEAVCKPKDRPYYTLEHLCTPLILLWEPCNRLSLRWKRAAIHVSMPICLNTTRFEKICTLEGQRQCHQQSLATVKEGNNLD